MLYKLPNLGEGITEGTVVNVLVKAGDVLKLKQAVTDLNADGHPDVVVADECDNAVSVLLNTGDKLESGGYQLGAFGYIVARRSQ